MTISSPNTAPVEDVILPQVHDLGAGFEVRRALPSAKRQMVGPFIFFDAFGPTVFAAGDGIDVRPHPHIGLATLTYLTEGEILHRDSVGHVQAIRPGEVNLMTAGRGIVHSERTAGAVRTRENTLSGQQVWLALPKGQEEGDPGFAHHAAQALPRTEGEGVSATLIVGTAFGLRSPVLTPSETIYADVTFAPRARFRIPAEHAERAVYVVTGALRVAGQDGSFASGELVVFKPGAEVIVQAGDAGAHVMLIGGEPLPEKRFIRWNFVSSSQARIEQAIADWRARRFPGVPGETEYIPLP